MYFVLVGQGPDFLDRIFRSRPGDQKDIDILIPSFQGKFYIIPVQIGIAVLGVDDVIALIEQQLSGLLQEMRIGSIENHIHSGFWMMFFDRGKKIRTEISPVQIFEPFSFCEKIEELQSDAVRQHCISVQNSTLICRIYALDIHILIVGKQRLTEIF